MLRIKVNIIFFIFWPCLAFTQTADYIVYYDFSCVKDTSTLERHPVDSYMLYKVGHVSRFVHMDKYKKDSLTNIFLTKNPDPSSSGFPMTQQEVDFFISKFHEFKAKNHFNIPSDIRVDKNFQTGFLMMYAQHSLPQKWMKETSKLDWKIHSQKEEYKGYTVQSATCTYGGRNYIAKFTRQIPINDGPFIFSGLPGLILSVKDDNGWYGFTINSVSLKERLVFFDSNYYGKKPQLLELNDFADWMYKEMTDPEIPMGLLDGAEMLKLRLIDKRRDRFDLLIIR